MRYLDNGLASDWSLDFEWRECAFVIAGGGSDDVWHCISKRSNRPGKSRQYIQKINSLKY